MRRLEAKIAKNEDIGLLLELRKEFLVTEIGATKEQMEAGFMEQTRVYFENTIKNGEEVSCLAYLEGRLAGCGTLCYLNLIPTLDHQTGKRAHLMNIYVRKECRRNGVGKCMLSLLLEEARKHGVTEVSLDATDDGRKLYQSYGFSDNHEAMVILIPQQ